MELNKIIKDLEFKTVLLKKGLTLKETEKLLTDLKKLSLPSKLY
jgi:hypothetical protein